MTEWLDNPNANGQKPDDIFDISAEDDAKMRQKDAEAREEYEKQKKEAEQKSIEAGKKSRKEEAFRIGGKALRAVLMQLLAELVREIIAKLVKWFKSAKKALDLSLIHICSGSSLCSLGYRFSISLYAICSRMSRKLRTVRH